MGADPLVLIVNNDEQVGLQEAAERIPVVPVGSPETLKETACGLPDAKVALTVLLPEDPAVSETALELEIEKSKGCMTENKASTSGLALYPLLNALPLIIALLFTVKVPV